jgi:hypothetical protein
MGNIWQWVFEQTDDLRAKNVWDDWPLTPPGNRWLHRESYSTGRANVGHDRVGEDAPYKLEPRDLQGPTFESTFREIFDEAFKLLVDRQRKYGSANIQRLGLWGVFDRLSADKIERVRRAFNGTLAKGVLTLDDQTDFEDESFEDALLDIANYALIMLSLKRGVWGRPLQEDA